MGNEDGDLSFALVVKNLRLGLYCDADGFCDHRSEKKDFIAVFLYTLTAGAGDKTVASDMK